jgi:hypothetical protein
LLEVDPTRMCELLVGLPDVTVLGIDDIDDGPLVIHIGPADGSLVSVAVGSRS